MSAFGGGGHERTSERASRLCTSSVNSQCGGQLTNRITIMAVVGGCFLRGYFSRWCFFCCGALTHGTFDVAENTLQCFYRETSRTFNVHKNYVVAINFAGTGFFSSPEHNKPPLSTSWRACCCTLSTTASFMFNVRWRECKLVCGAICQLLSERTRTAGVLCTIYSEQTSIKCDNDARTCTDSHTS